MNTFSRRLAEDMPLLMAERLCWMADATFTDREVHAAEHPYFKRLKEVCKPQMEMFGDVAVVPVEGPLAYNPDAYEMAMLGVEDSRNVLSMIKTAGANPDVKGVLLRMDTPGGMMLGGPEIADGVAEQATFGVRRPLCLVRPRGIHRGY